MQNNAIYDIATNQFICDQFTREYFLDGQIDV